MKLFLKEITAEPLELSFDETNPWLVESVLSIDEQEILPDLRDQKEPPPKRALKKREIQTSFQIQKVDEVVVIQGKIQTFVELLCSRCANPFPYACKTKFNILFCQDPSMAGVGYLEKQKNVEGKEFLKPAGQIRGFARHAHEEDAEDPWTRDSMSGKDLDITYLSNDFIVLSEVVAEQLQLILPFQPLCKQECKGMCSQCGADLNVGRCACAKIGSLAFLSLKNFKAH